jgi:hypothetical protein
MAHRLVKSGYAHTHYEADMAMINAQGEYLFAPQRLGECHRWCQEATKAALSRGESVVVSNTTLTKKEARPYIEMAHELGAEIEIIHLDGDYGSIHDVPDWKVEEMKNKREKFALKDFDI